MGPLSQVRPTTSCGLVVIVIDLLLHRGVIDMKMVKWIFLVLFSFGVVSMSFAGDGGMGQGNGGDGGQGGMGQGNGGNVQNQQGDNQDDDDDDDNDRDDDDDDRDDRDRDD